MANIQDILDSFPEIIYVADIKTYEILYINAAGKKIFPEAIGKKCYEVMYGLNEPCGKCPIVQTEQENYHIWKYKNEKVGKTYLFRDSIITWENRNAHMCIAFDITNDENTKQELETRLQSENFTLHCIAQMHRNMPYDKMFDELLEMIGKFLGADRVYIFDYDGVSVKNIHEWCNKGIASTAEFMMDAHIMKERIPEFMRRKCFVIKDIEEIKDTSPQEYAELLYQNTHSLIAAPLFDNDNLIGYIGADNPPPEKMDSVEVFFTTISYFVASIAIKEKTEKKLMELGYTDSLTGLYNRNKFIDVTTLLSGTVQKNFGVVYADLNGLKEINDQYGHAAGDEALISIANAIVKTFGAQSSYRVGGDEFVVLCRNCAEGQFLENIETLKNYIEQTEYTAAIGYKHSVKPCYVNDIVKVADEKMYQDKKFFYRNKKKSARYRHRNDILSIFASPDTLKKLIEEERFFILFQPRFNPHTFELCGAEALIRYFDDEEAVIAPTDFLPEIEDNDLIHIIDFYVFRHVCKYLSSWVKSGKDPKPVSINLSHKTLLKPNFLENFMNIWYDYDISRELIEIEVSEDKEKGGISDILNVLSDLKKNGFKIAIDNFGYKYADLYLFADLKFDILKLDRDLVYKIETDQKTHKLSASLAGICRNENIRLVAEGVESEKELALMRDIGCDEVQGYFFDKPMAWKEFEKKYLK
jgi:diguanylate cyclase (GGDEF)-like protein